ncbi:hypothetical protein EGV01_21770 [Pseudomonas syringae pv. theae]|nr:hypothetical protein [Pseudomonas syringae pv. theae]
MPIISTIVRRSASHAVLDALRPILDVLARARASQRQRLNPSAQSSCRVARRCRWPGRRAACQCGPG